MSDDPWGPSKYAHRLPEVAHQNFLGLLRWNDPKNQTYKSCEGCPHLRLEYKCFHPKRLDEANIIQDKRTPDWCPLRRPDGD